MTRSKRMLSDPGEPETNRIIDEALNMALMTTRLLVAWHSGETGAQDSMQIRWKASARSDLPRTAIRMRRNADEQS
jgi:hypothetical protein